MKKNFKTSVIFLLILSIMLSLSLTSTLALKDKNADNKCVFNIPVGSGEGRIAYSPVAEDKQRFGASSFAVSNNYEFHILDNVDQQIEIFSKDGKSLGTVNLTDDDYFDIEVKNNGNYMVLSYKGYVSEIDKSGNVINKLEVQKPNMKEAYMNFMSLYKDKNGDIALRDSKEGTERNLENGVISTSFDGVSVEKKGKDLQLSHKSKKFKVKYNYQPNGTYPIASTSTNELLMVEKEAIRGREVYVENRISKYKDGEKVGMALAEPTVDYEVIPHKFLYATKTGDVYQMICDKNNVAIYNLSVTSKEKTKLTEDFVAKLNGTDNSNVASPSLYKSENTFLSTRTITSTTTDRYNAWVRGLEMAEYVWTFNPATMKTPYTTYTTPPEHLRGSSTIQVTGIPYKWGGDDNISQFSTKLAQGKTAGDIKSGTTSSYVVSSVTGIDCSGFISRAYNIYPKLGTTTMSREFEEPEDYDPELGDIFNKPGSHVVMFVSNENSGYDGSWLGINTLESTDVGSIDGCKEWFESASYLQSCTLMRKK